MVLIRFPHTITLNFISFKNASLIVTNFFHRAQLLKILLSPCLLIGSSPIGAYSSSPPRPPPWFLPPLRWFLRRDAPSDPLHWDEMAAGGSVASTSSPASGLKEGGSGRASKTPRRDWLENIAEVSGYLLKRCMSWKALKGKGIWAYIWLNNLV